jgi:flagellar M-ring protein FliF
MSLLGGFKATSPGRQLLVVVLAVAVLGGLLVAGYLTFFKSNYSPLFTNLRTMDAATIVAALDKKKTPYKLKDGGATILVPTDLVDTTRLAVMSEDLPIKGAVGFELFNKSDMGLTEFAQKINYQRALQGELARTIMTMEAIDAARVHLSLPEPTIFREDRRPPKASVTLVTRSGKQLSAGTIRGIRRLVAAAIPDLDLANVVILDDNGEVVSNDIPVDAAPSSGVQTKRAIEQFYAAKVRRALDSAYPNGEVTVEILPALDAAASRDSSDAALQSWTPQDRRFRLGVTVAVRGALTPEVQDDVRGIVREAAGLHTDAGDVVAVTPASSINAPDVAAATAAEAAPAPRAAPRATVVDSLRSRRLAPDLGSPFAFWMTLSAVLLLPLIAVAAVLARRRGGLPRRLSAQQRLAYTVRLKTLLEKEAVDVTPTA